MRDYEATRRSFSWSSVRTELRVADDGSFNMAATCLRQATDGNASRVALRWLGPGEQRREISYADLRDLALRCATILDGLGVPSKAVVASFLGRVPELYATALGAIGSGRVYCPLFSAFGPDPVRTRLALGSAAVLVTNLALYRRKIAPIRNQLPGLQHILIVRTTGDEPVPDGTLDFCALLTAAAPAASFAHTTVDDPALLHFTSGTTGMPKGVTHVHGALVAQFASARLALDLRDADIFWCTADPGWVTGTAYGILAPLACAATLVVDNEEFDAQRWYEILDKERVNVWYSAPTAIRLLMKAGLDLLAGRHFPALRHLASVGEPLDASAVLWSEKAYGIPFHDNWWQTETGAIMVANYPGMPVRPGSMGRPMPGIDAGVVERLESGHVRELTEPDQTGELALRTGWPSMFRGYIGQEERYAACFRDDWYLTGDLVRRDRDGYYWFVARADDVIKSAGHLISPFEVESALLRHPAVAGAAVIGLPDPIAYQTVKAYVELHRQHTDSEALRRDILAHARRSLGAAVAPRDIAIVASLPRTRSGKILRRLLRARELGEPEGDLSTLESAA